MVIPGKSQCLRSLGGRPLALSHRSFYPLRLDDPSAVYVSGVVGDGEADDTDAIQAAINSVVERTTRGILFIPSGIYRLSRSLVVWPGVRLIGYGPTRPVLVLGDATPGYQGAPAYLVHFAGNIPGRVGNGAGFVFQPGAPRPTITDFAAPPRDANPGTFYSALSNIDLVIGEDNPSAAAVRSTFAQHCFIAHSDLWIGSGFAGIHDGGNVCEDVHFHGGDHGIVTITPSPGWQYLLIDASFEGQRIAAIRCEQSGLTLIRPSFREVPTAVAMHPERGEQLWIRDGRMEDISGPALLIGDEDGSRNQVNVQDLVCQRVPILARFQQSGREIPGVAAIYQVASFSHGLHLSGRGLDAEERRIRTQIDIASLAALPAVVPSDIPELPDQASWVDVRQAGLVGDGIADESEALQRAIDAHRTLYFPCGAYRISRTIRLRPDSVLIGLHSGAVRIFIADATPAFSGIGPPVAMIEAPSGGQVVMLGLGLYTNAINPRAVAVKWMSGERSYMNDVRFLGGHGTAQLSGEPEAIYLHNRSADADPLRLWDTQHPSLWITEGGGGVFLDIWTASTFAHTGLHISRTTTRGRIYAMSVEHHVRCEVKIEDAANWELYALQLEEERGESGQCLPLSIARCRDLLFANLFLYRVISSNQTFPCAVRVSASHALCFRGFHAWTNSRADFDHALIDATSGLRLRQSEFAALTVDSFHTLPPLPAGPGLRRLAGGFQRLAGGAVDASGRFYAVDARRQEIHRWDGSDQPPECIADQPHQPVNLIGDASGNLLVVSYTGCVYLLQPDRRDSPIQVLDPQPASPRPGSQAVLPANLYTRGIALATGRFPTCLKQVVSPDGSVFIPVAEDFLAGTLSWGVKDHDLLRAYGLQKARPGTTAYLSLERDGRTFAVDIDAAGHPCNCRLFAQIGGTAVAVGPDGLVYIAEDHVHVFRPDGVQVEVIATPERPLGLVFGGGDGRTLFMPTGRSLYALIR
jgi:hypothetical protein